MGVRTVAMASSATMVTDPDEGNGPGAAAATRAR